MKKINISHNQLSLPFAQRTSGASRAISFEDRQRFFWFMVGASLLSLVIYIYAVNATAHNIAIRQNLESEVAQVQVRLSSLEFSSIALKNDITIETAKAYGFNEVKEPLYVSRNSAGSLTLNTVTR